MCGGCRSLPTRMGLSGCKISHLLLPRLMAYCQPQHGNQMMASPPDRILETHGRILENFIIETLHFSRIHFVLCFCVPFAWGPFVARLSSLRHLFRSLNKNILFFYYSYCPIFNVFYCAGHCIITLRCSLLSSTNLLFPSVAMLHHI
jgi:hypothetical protein